MLPFVGVLYKLEEHSVDGSCLADLTEDDLTQELHIKSKIIVKKLMTCIKDNI